MPELREKLQKVLGAKFRLVRELTGGGMSRVFLAMDEQLQREVVVKVLSPDLLDDTRVERFRQEVLQTARLQHPAIIPVLDVGAIDEGTGHRVPFYLMPYAKGESLRSRLNHEGQLSIGLALRVLRNVFDALAHAHGHGVIHRDIKPENIFLSGSNALLADFGIAKAIAGPGSSVRVSTPGVSVGTPTYTAPEQFVDSERVGPRADLYAVGVVGYEMLTGRLPWTSSNRLDRLASQALHQFTPLRTLRPDVPPTIAAVLEACLAWDANQRPDSAASLMQVLESVAVNLTPTAAEFVTPDAPRAPEAPPRRRLVRRPAVAAVLLLAVAAGALVLPTLARDGARGAAPMRELAVLPPELPDMAGSPSNDLAVQLYQMMTGALAPVSGLRLRGHVSVPRLAALGLAPSQIVDSLRNEGIDSALVFNATATAGDSAVLQIRLRRLSLATHEVVAGPLTIHGLARLAPDSLSRVVRQLVGESIANLRLTSAGRSVAVPRLTEAYLAWLAGRDAMSKRTPEGFRDAIAHLERAVALDSGYAQAHADLAQTLTLGLTYHYRMSYAPFDAAVRALRHANRAVALQPDFADGYLARGLLGATIGAPIDYIQSNYDSVARLLSANPYSQTWYLGAMGRQGRFAEAVERAEEEVRLDPQSAAQRVASALYALPAGQYVTAIRNATVARSFTGTSVPLVAQLELWGRLLLGGSALAECAEVPAGPYLGARALCLERTGRVAEGRAAADSLLTMLTRTVTDSTFDYALAMGEMALYAAQHGDRAGGRQWVRQAFGASPAGIDYRLMRSEMFAPEDIALADSLQADTWARVRVAARRRAP